ncbi:protein of unknown function [Paraburkholderia kururiensis]
MRNGAPSATKKWTDKSGRALGHAWGHAWDLAWGLASSESFPDACFASADEDVKPSTEDDAANDIYQERRTCVRPTRHEDKHAARAAWRHCRLEVGTDGPVPHACGFASHDERRDRNEAR